MIRRSLIETQASEVDGSAAIVRAVVSVQGTASSQSDSTLALVSVSRLTKSFGRRVAVRDLSFELTPGITGLLGPNGAGKSTLVRCLAGLCGWGEGVVRIAGIDPVWRARETRAMVGFMPERVSFPPEMRVDRYLRFAAEAKGLDRAQRASAVETALGRAGLEAVGSRIIANLSKGYRQRVGLAQAMLGDPPVLILDEPSAGLDPLQMIEIRDVVRAYAKGRVVLIATHILPEARRICDRVLVMNQGRLVYDGPPSGLAATVSPQFRLQVVDAVGAQGAPAIDESGIAVLECISGDGRYELLVEVASQVSLGELVAGLSASGWWVVAVEPASDPLEEAFRGVLAGARGTDDRPANGRER